MVGCNLGICEEVSEYREANDSEGDNRFKQEGGFAGEVAHGAGQTVIASSLTMVGESQDALSQTQAYPNNGQPTSKRQGNNGGWFRFFRNGTQQQFTGGSVIDLANPPKPK